MLVIACNLGPACKQMGKALDKPCSPSVFPETTSVMAVNRYCSSGLQATANIAAAIRAGYTDIGIGAGVESMSIGGGGGEAAAKATADAFFNKANLDNALANDCLIPMGITSENVAEDFGITRLAQDQFALESHNKALEAQKAGKFRSEIVPVTVQVTDPQGMPRTVTVVADEGPRPTTLESLQRLPAAFTKDGGSTAGNSSQVSDGAAAVLLMRRSKAKELGLKPLACFRSFAVAGVPPRIMGIGPVFAIPLALKQSGLEIKDIDVWEINEAFASQALYCVETLGIDKNKVNPNGGAIALGHPLGCTGARQIATLLPELRRRQKKYGAISMCIGTGMGACAVLENEDL